MSCASFLKKLLGLLFLKKTQFQDKLILKCYRNGYFPKSMKILKISSFNKMEHQCIGMAMFEVSKRNSTSTLDRSHRTPSLSTTLVAAKITKPYTLRFVLRVYIKDRVFVPPLAAGLDYLKSRITTAVNSFDEDTLRGVWDEFNY